MKAGMELTDYLNSAFFNEIMQLEAFRRELKTFLDGHHLPCDIVHHFKLWSGFIYLYTSVVAEIPLMYTKGDRVLPGEVEELMLTHLPAQPPTSPQRHVRWEMKLKRGEKKVAATLYGVYRDENKNVTGMPDFFLEPGFQV